MNWENMDGTMKTLGSVENPEKNRKDIYYQKPNANLSKKHKRTTGQQELRGKMTLNLLKNKEARRPQTVISTSRNPTVVLSDAFSPFLSLTYNVSVCIYIHAHTCILYTNCDHPSSSTLRRERLATHERLLWSRRFPLNLEKSNKNEFFGVKRCCLGKSVLAVAG